ncbi:MAG: hypothetical protein HeimC3_27800 [Candidatus Heimdallarchaeota archaeon LC_3]|nr:MAG: hypothetical protein HeimC3_27800 [Candidatus Heimdallarchaeota archaeon LC_3]
MTEIIVTVLDTPIGPVALYSESDTGSIDEQLLKKAPFRSNLSLSLMEEDSSLENADAVLPFSEMNKTGYCYYFYIPSKNQRGRNICAIIYLLPIEQNFELYKIIPILKTHIAAIAKKIIKEYTFEQNKSLPKSIQESFQDILHRKQLIEKLPEPSISQIHASIQRLSEELTGNWDYLIKKIDRNLESVIFDVIIEQPLFIASNSSVLVKLAMASLEYFTPKKKLLKGFMEDYVENIDNLELDLIGINKKMVSKVKHYTIIDLDKENVINYTNRNHFKEFLKSLRGLKSLKEFELQIKHFLDQLYSKATELVDIFNQTPLDNDKIKDFQKNLDKDELEAIIEITAKRNPLISTMLKESMGKKVSSWLGDF